MLRKIFEGFVIGLICVNQALFAGNQTALNDEFAYVLDFLNNNTSDWQVLGSGAGDERAVFIQSDGQKLSIIPEEFEHNAWFEDEYGPLVYKNVQGNFAVAIHVKMLVPNQPSIPPSVGFNAGGLVIRDPSGTHSGDENWVMYNLGGQGQNGVSYAREMKKTIQSRSNLYLTEQTRQDEFLLACRVGSLFYFYHWSEIENNWIQETFYNQFSVNGVITTTWRNSGDVTPEIQVPAPGQESPMHFDHPGLPDTLQVGIMAHSWTNYTDGIQGDFEFVRFAPNAPQTSSDCTSSFAQLGIDVIITDGFE
ncbi:MAG: hypothetical protein ACWA5R_02065 [bacterium]